MINKPISYICSFQELQLQRIWKSWWSWRSWRILLSHCTKWTHVLWLLQPLQHRQENWPTELRPVQEVKKVTFEMVKLKCHSYDLVNICHHLSPLVTITVLSVTVNYTGYLDPSTATPTALRTSGVTPTLMFPPATTTTTPPCHARIQNPLVNSGRKEKLFFSDKNDFSIF